MRVIELTKGFVAIVDDEDFEAIAQYRWHVGGRHEYAIRKRYNHDGTKTRLQMHRVIMGVTDPKVFIDHKNRNTLDNRRENLRIATSGQNIANSKVHKNNLLGVKGVCFRPPMKTRPYQAQIRQGGKTRNLGYFKTPEEAHAAYCKAAVAVHGEFARFN